MIGDDQKLYVCACIRKVTTKLQDGGQWRQRAMVGATNKVDATRDAEREETYLRSSPLN